MHWAWSGARAKLRPGLHNRLKDIDAKLDLPPLQGRSCVRFVDWVADYTLAPRGMVLRMALRMGEDLGPARERSASALRARARSA